MGGGGYLASVLIEGADDRRHQGAILLCDDAHLVRLGELGVSGDTGRLVTQHAQPRADVHLGRVRVRVRGVGVGVG